MPAEVSQPREHTREKRNSSALGVGMVMQRDLQVAMAQSAEISRGKSDRDARREGRKLQSSSSSLSSTISSASSPSESSEQLLECDGISCACGALLLTLNPGDDEKRLKMVYEHDKLRAAAKKGSFDIAQKWTEYQSRTVSSRRIRRHIRMGDLPAHPIRTT